MSNKRKSVIVLLLLIASVSSALTFAYWSSSVEGNENNTNQNITVGEGNTAETIVSVVGENNPLPLVPAGYAEDGQSVEEVELTFEVKWDSKHTNAAQGTRGTLKTSINPDNGLKIDEAVAHEGLKLVNLKLPSDVEIIADGEPVSVTVSFTLTEPADKTEYEAIANKSIEAIIDFEVTVNE